MQVTGGLTSKSGTEDGTAFSAVAPSWRPSPPFDRFVNGTSMKTDSSILRRLIRMRCWFEPLILRLGPCDFRDPALTDGDRDGDVQALVRPARGKPFFFAGTWMAWEGARGIKKVRVVGQHELFAFQTKCH
jgi:hypothetical protein